METLKENSSCPSCSYPARAGHASDCALLKNDKPEKDDGEIKHEIEKDARELIPPVEGLIEEDGGVQLISNDFVAFRDVGAKEIVAPFVVGENAVFEQPRAFSKIKETPSMGKAAFVEKRQSIDGVDYNFLQWKGVGSNKINKRMEERTKAHGAKMVFPLGDKGFAPLFLMKIGGNVILRFRGAAYYADLLDEAEQAERFAAFGLRMPKIVQTVKFSREFAAANDLPLPDNDEMHDVNGQSLLEYVEARRDMIDPELYRVLTTKVDIGERDDNDILGENVRAFRNVLRVDDIEKIALNPDKGQRDKQLKAMIDSSAKILATELGREVNALEFAKEFSRILGEQASILINNRLIQGALKNHKQDITLAGEICDFDGAFQVTDEYLNDPKERPGWVTDEATEQGWRAETDIQVDQQLLLLAAHFKPVVDAVADMGGETAGYSESVNAFVEALNKGLSPEQRSRLRQEIGSYAGFHDIKAIAGNDKMTESNLAGCDGIFSDIVEKLKKLL